MIATRKGLNRSLHVGIFNYFIFYKNYSDSGVNSEIHHHFCSNRTRLTSSMQSSLIDVNGKVCLITVPSCLG